MRKDGEGRRVDYSVIQRAGRHGSVAGAKNSSDCQREMQQPKAELTCVSSIYTIQSSERELVGGKVKTLKSDGFIVELQSVHTPGSFKERDLLIPPTFEIYQFTTILLFILHVAPSII